MPLPNADNALHKILINADEIQAKLDRSIFHLRTLYEINREIYGIVDTDHILNNFLMMTMGSFGVIQGFVAIIHTPDMRIRRMVSRGIEKEESAGYISCCRKLVAMRALAEKVHCHDPEVAKELLPIEIERLFSFTIQKDCLGLLGTGAKISGEAFHREDLELIERLLRNLSRALTNALSFEDINKLNEQLRRRNAFLEEKINDLKGLMKT